MFCYYRWRSLSSFMCLDLVLEREHSFLFQTFVFSQPFLSTHFGFSVSASLSSTPPPPPPTLFHFYFLDYRDVTSADGSCFSFLSVFAPTLQTEVFVSLTFSQSWGIFWGFRFCTNLHSSGSVTQIGRFEPCFTCNRYFIPHLA